MFKKFLDTVYKYKEKLSKFRLIVLYFQYIILFKNIKKEIFDSQVITHNDIMTVGKILEVSSSMLNFNTADLRPPIINIYDSSVTLEIDCEPVRLLLSSSNLSYRYELYIKDFTGSKETHIERMLNNINLDRKSEYGHDHDVYDLVFNYVDAMLDDIRDYWLGNIVERILHENGKSVHRKNN